MDKILEMATKAGMDQKQGETASGGILSFLKGKLGDEQFSKIADKIPGAGDAAQKYEDESSSASSGSGGMGGMLGSAMSSFTKSSGGGSDSGGVAGLTAMLASKGIDAGQLSKFMPQIASFLKDKAGIDVTSVLGLPSDGDSSTSGGGNPADSAKKMFGGFGKMFGK